MRISDYSEAAEQETTSKLQSWMTLFTCLFTYLCLTEIKDKFLRHNLLVGENDRRPRQYEEYEEQIDCDLKPCLYEMILCGSLRNCLFRNEAPGENNAINRKKGTCGVVTFTILTFVFGAVMEASHTQWFSNTAVSLQPHFMDDS